VAVALSLSGSSVALAEFDVSAVDGSKLDRSSSSSSTTDTVYVAPSGRDGGPGTAEEPLRTISRAVQIAPDGATVMIGSGRYHEQVQVFEKELHLVAAPGATVVIDGTTPMTAWSASRNGNWSAPWLSDFDRAGPPFTVIERPEAGWPEQLFIDGTALEQVGVLDDLRPGSFFHDRVGGRMWIADDPTGRLLEGSDLNWGLYLNRAHGSSARGIVVQRFATRTKDMAAVRVYADDVTIDAVSVVDNARIGLSVIGRRVHVTGVVAQRNGHLGLHGHQSADLTISSAQVHENNRAGFDPFHSAGGIKITESINVVVEQSSVTSNSGPGIWTDLSVTDVVIRSNFVTENTRSGIEIELSSRIVVIDNTVRDNGEAGVWVLESSVVDVWHNAVYNNVRDVWVEDGPRSDVNDVRIFNNLFGGDVRADAAWAILSVDDWTEQRSAFDMRVIEGSNRYWIVPGSITAVSRWSRWPASPAVSLSIEAHQSVTGYGVGSSVVVAATDPFSRSAFDARQPQSAPLGSAMSAALVEASNGDVRHAAAGPLRSFVMVEPPVDTPHPPPAPPPVRLPFTPTAPPLIDVPAAPPVSRGLDEPATALRVAKRMSAHANS
jgi:parallel beta-helix repeat protein